MYSPISNFGSILKSVPLLFAQQGGGSYNEKGEYGKKLRGTIVLRGCKSI